MKESLASSVTGWRKLVVALALAAGVVVVDIHFGLHARLLAGLFTSVAFFRTRSLAACAWYVLAYVTASLSCVPLTPFEIFTGFCFGLPLGLLLDVTGRVLGAVMSFSIARMLSRRGYVSLPFLSGDSAVLRGVGNAIEEEGLRFLVLFNMAYVPVAVKNYGLGFVPEVHLAKFVLAIIIVEVPMASIWATIGNAAAQDLLANGVTLTNVTAVQEVILGAHEGVALKGCLLLVGGGAVLTVMHIVHKKVAQELDRIKLRKDSVV